MVRVTHFLERVERPAAPLAYEAQDRGEVVRHDDAREPRTVDQPSSLEDVLVLHQECLLVCGRRIEISLALIQVQEPLGDVLRRGRRVSGPN